MIYAILLLVCVLVLFSSVAIYKHRVGERTSSIQFWQWGDQFIAFYPNPGFQILDLHWCRDKGWHEAHRPKKLGLGPGKFAEEGTLLYTRRMQYLRNGK